MFAIVNSAIEGLRVRMLHRASRYRVQLSELPPDLFAYWQGFVPREFAGMPTGRLFFAQAAEGLINFFDCVNQSGRACALPSKAADSVWHAWAKLKPQHLERFCIKHFVRPIPHIEASDMAGRMGSVVANCLVAARRIESLAPAAPHIPALFSLDRRLRMPGGFDYVKQRKQVGFRYLGDDGMPLNRASFPKALTAAELFAAGLVSRAEYLPHAPKGAAAQGDGGSGGGGCGSSSSSIDCDNDGGGDSGGDGGGCGGGCGGGGGD